MAAKEKIDGVDMEGEHMEFEVQKDAWQEIRLPDSTVLKIKLVVTDVFKATRTTDAGEPVYYVRSVPVLAPIAKGKQS